MKIMVINGPNLNMLGKREPEHYGTDTLESIEQALTGKGKALGCELIFFQSNHEGGIIDFIQEKTGAADGILINPGALTHYGYSLHDALADAGLPVVEVHLSDIQAREEWRKISVISDVVIKQISGLKTKSYLLGLEALAEYIRSQKKK
ncbi:MAG: type II 3-dehydroquinate dehydratase [Deltaproteobacteria bacterium]|nr:type II 3-dehydroquinate dehydratase [Deltaproteobacteria bacterium]